MEFQFNGGIGPRGEKIHVFLVIAGQEVIVYDALKMGLCERSGATKYSTKHDLVKVYVSQYVAETQISHSFYFRLSAEAAAPKATIRNIDDTAGYFFVGRGRFLRKEEILAVLAPDNRSRFFLRTPTTAILRAMVTLEAANAPKSTVVEGRRVGKKKQKGGSDDAMLATGRS